jgi:ketosteroid isomerase-like protein
MSASENKETIRRIYAALERGDRTVFGQSVHPDYAWALTGQSDWARRFEGQEAVRRDLLGPLFNLFADTYTARAINLIADGDQVAAEVRGSVMTRSGKRYDNEYCFIFRFEDGKIREVVEYRDTALEATALGAYDDAVAAYRAKAPG